MADILARSSWTSSNAPGRLMKKVAFPASLVVTSAVPVSLPGKICTKSLDKPKAFIESMARFPRESAPTALNKATVFPSRCAATEKFSGAPPSISELPNTSHRISPSARSLHFSFPPRGQFQFRSASFAALSAASQRAVDTLRRKLRLIEIGDKRGDSD